MYIPRYRLAASKAHKTMLDEMITPPTSPESDGLIFEKEISASISSTFFPQDDPPTDLIIITSDNVWFFVHKNVLCFKSDNAFGGYLDQPDAHAIMVSESSDVLNLVLYTFYDLDPVHCKPKLDQMTKALSALSSYGRSLQSSITRGKPIYDTIRGLAVSSPLEIYTLAAQYGLEDLAVDSSHYLLSTPLHNLTDEQCLRMGPIYLRRLMFLHLGRTERLKLLLKEVPGHKPTMQCGAIEQRHDVEIAWKEATTSLCWDANASTAVSTLHSILSPSVNKVSCEDCKVSMRERIRHLIVDWALVKSTV